MTQTTQDTTAYRYSCSCRWPRRRRSSSSPSASSDWWPKDSHPHPGRGRAAAVIARAASSRGRWYERAEDGSECDWGFVREVDRPERILLAWHLDPEWKFDPDPAKATEVEVPSLPRRTRRA